MQNKKETNCRMKQKENADAQQIGFALTKTVAKRGKAAFQKLI